jgi:outer membrane receptor protein involved in Fe transport
VDLSLGWKVNDSIAATLGGRNVFSRFPDRDTTTTCCGQIYPDTAADWFGAFWYLNVSANF